MGNFQKAPLQWWPSGSPGSVGPMEWGTCVPVVGDPSPWDGFVCSNSTQGALSRTLLGPSQMELILC